jgi:signal transduction histidine kinase/ligand-binding sensor domain-containing protein
LSKKSNIKFERISLEEGLSQSVVSCIIQDYLGFMWFGTQDGLNRYDGTKFITYKNDSKNKNSICNNFIVCLFEDTNKNLWIGTKDGLSMYDRNRDLFFNYKVEHDNSNLVSSNQINAIAEDKAGNFWIGTYGSGIINFDRGKNIFSVYRRNENDPYSLSENRINDIRDDGEGNLWVGTWGGGLNFFDIKNKKFIRHQLSKDENNNISIRRINSLYTDSNGILFVCTNNGLYEYSKKENEFINYSNDPQNQFSLSDDLVSLIYEDSAGNYWVGTREGGLNSFDRKSGEFYSYKYDMEIPSGISNNSIMTIYEDRSGIIWIGTFGGGINKFNKQPKKIQHYFSDSGNPSGLSSNDVCCFCEDSENNIWIGTRDSGICVFNRTKKTFTNFRHNPDDINSLCHDMVNSIIEDNDGNIWIGTLGGGLNKFDKKTKQFTHYKNDPGNKNSLSHNTVFTLAKDKRGIIWIGTSGGGLNKFDAQTEKFTKYISDTANASAISSNSIISIFNDSDDTIWIGTDNGGLNKFNSREEKFFHYTHNPDNLSSISGNGILTIYEDSSGTLWFGTSGFGLNRFNKDKKTFERITEKDGLPNNVINGILEDNKGNLWISTNNGLSKFNPKTPSFRHYDARDGFQSNEFNNWANLKLKNGELLFGGINGFNIFNPEDMKDNSFIPPVVITDFQIFNKHVPVSEKNQILKKAISVESEIILSYRESVFSFEFVSLDYSIPGKNQYAYKMDGFDKEWVYSGNRRFVTYTNLDHGEYLFRVKGSNNDGVWNENGAKIKITITPPFWKTWWFRTLGILTIAGAAGGVYQNKLNQVRKEKRAQEEFTKRLIDVQESDRKQIALELHDSIGQDLLITKNKLLLSVKKPDDKEFLLQNINEVSDIISDTLKDVREISYSLHPYQIERLGLSKAIKSITDRVSKSTDLKFTTNIDDIDKLLPSEFEISLYRVIQESINNIIKHSKATEVILNISKGSDDISILISDNGKGFSYEKVKANSDKHGFGLSGMNERIKILKGKFNIDSSPGNGTAINIHVPIK